MDKTIRIEPLNTLTDSEYEKLKEGLKKINGFRFTIKISIVVD